MSDKWKVSLIRAPYLANIGYWYNDKPTALSHAYELAEQHRHCTVSVISATHHIYIHASAWYSRKEVRQ